MNKIWAENNKDIINNHKMKYRRNNLDKIKEYAEKNKEKHNERNKKYRKTQKGILTSNIQTNKRRAKEKELEASLTKEQWLQCKEYFKNKCCYCGGNNQLEQEHFIPLSKGGGYTKNNIVIACKSCNSSKSNKDFFEWYPSQKFYNSDTEQNILKYLNKK